MALTEVQRKARNRHKSRKIAFFICLFAAVVCFIIVSLLGKFTASSTKNIQNAMEVIQEESTAQTIKTLTIKLDDAARFVVAASGILSEFDDIQGTAAIAELERISASSDFRRMAVVNLQGVSLLSDGSRRLVDISDREYFVRAMEGESGISQAVNSKLDDMVILNIFAPIIQNDKIVGMVYGAYTTDQLTEFVSLDSFGGEGHSYIFDKTGKVIWLPGENDLSEELPMNLWDQLKQFEFTGDVSYGDFYGNVLDNQTGVVEYDYDGTLRTAYYTPMGINEWYILSVLPTSYIDHYMEPLHKDAVRLILWIVVVVVIAMGIGLLYIFRERCALAIANRKLDLMANSIPGGALQLINSENLPFAYINEGFLKLSGFSVEEIAQTHQDCLMEMVHPEDQEALAQIIATAGAEEGPHEIQFRLICKDGGYKWILCNVAAMPDKRKTIDYYAICVDIQRQYTEHMEVKEKAEKDQMTGLYNRVQAENLAREFLQSPECENGGYTAFCVLDLDHFKYLNDTYGHMKGDEVLQKVSKLLLTHTRSSDIVGRLGGDEFLILIKSMPDIQKIEEKAEEICTAVEALELDGGMGTTASLGLAIVPKDGQKFQMLYMKADNALYKAKQNGKNQYAFYENSK